MITDMSSAASTVPPARRTRSRPPSASSTRKPDDPSSAANGNGKTAPKPASPSHLPGERTVKKLRLSKALMMAMRRVDAVLLIDAQGLLSGIVTDKEMSESRKMNMKPNYNLEKVIMVLAPAALRFGCAALRL
jgi:hypothetical protein